MLEKERQIKRLQPPIDPIFKMLNYIFLFRILTVKKFINLYNYMDINLIMF